MNVTGTCKKVNNAIKYDMTEKLLHLMSHQYLIDINWTNRNKSYWTM